MIYLMRWKVSYYHQYINAIHINGLLNASLNAHLRQLEEWLRYANVVMLKCLIL